MSASEPCSKCSKIVYLTEKMEASHHIFHKACFKCSEPGCVLTLNLKNFVIVDETLYCSKHAPKPKATVITDSVNVMHALSTSAKFFSFLDAPRKSSEGLHKVQVGTGEVPSSLGLESLTLKHAVNAPRRSAENLGFVHKGSTHSSSESVQANGAAKALEVSD